ncbi:hypothetical protein EIP91_002475 [Steccherinum ochraceum]|uniref:Phosducin domain-containing protein n=1 Tax=Steccherinum ochraceum TaxID=92696 RepID=A0A4R0RC42_9APHY|nr:hypothetical protein EIP91_002475 [Steccherinum ochraceum]
MDGNIEDLVLSGKLFNPPSRSTSPIRTPSPSSPTRIVQWPNDADAEYEYDSDAERRRAIEEKIASQQEDSIGMGPGRTGVKGVIRDRDEANGMQRAKRADEVRALNKQMEKASLGGKTWAEEEEERLTEKAREEGKTVQELRSRGEAQARDDAQARRGRFGHLREVGLKGYLQAIESEERHVWVVVHIYDPSLDRCATLDDSLSRIARLHPSAKFLRVRAGAIGFASAQPTATSYSSSSLHVPKQPFKLTRTPSRKILVPGRYPTDEDDDEDDDDDEYGSSGGEEDQWDDDKVDTDVLPTMLVYRGGDLVHSWVRVDWEAKMGIEELLKRHHILSETRSSTRGDDFDDDDDLDDGELIFGNSDDE